MLLHLILYLKQKWRDTEQKRGDLKQNWCVLEQITAKN